MSEHAPVITIDGPSGTGKGTIMQRVAGQLGWHMLDSGALYRVLALVAQRGGIAWDSQIPLTELASQLAISFRTIEAEEAPHVFLGDEDVSGLIREPNMGNGASQVGAIASVRAALLALQRVHRRQPGLVTDGRDMGSVVFPDATLKIFLDANAKVRAERRVKQLQKSQMPANYAEILEKINIRDKRDRERTISPLRPAEDAIVIDTSNLSVQVITDQVLSLIRKRLTV